MSDSVYRMPAEWEPHDASWIGWPINESDWPGKLPAVQWAFVEFVRHLSRSEHLHILAPNRLVAEHAREKLRLAHVDLSACTFHLQETNRNWLRDAGAIFVRNRADRRLKALRFQFNAWARYDNFQLDQQIPGLMARTCGVDLVRPTISANGVEQWMVLEGGAIDTNGDGLLLTTEECLLSPEQERNPGFSRGAIEAALKKHLGCNQILWLKGGIVGDDTHGHVDDLARFVAPRTVVAVGESDPSSPNAAVLNENMEILRSHRDERGALEVVPLPMPAPLLFEGRHLPASYANFYMANGTVLVPTFNDPSDRVALGILQDLFPDRVVRGIHAVDLVWGFGTLHCLTQQQPSAA